MKRRITRMLAVALCVALALGAAACGEQQAQDGATPAPGQAADRDAVAVQIGEDFTVTYGEVADYYDYIVSMMSKYADRLIAHIQAHPEFIQPESRRNEMMNNFLLPGLQDLCVSRTSFQWGVPVDFDDRHVVYVWLDALTNYITGIGYDCDGGSTAQFARLWPADLHLIGKDIIRFHTIYWPIFLMALGLPLPKQVFGHPWLLQGDGKMSKSKGNVLYADDLVSVFGVDAVRYFVLHEMPFDNDGVITWELLVERINSDLANTLGNLVKRTVDMSNKYFGGVVERTGAAAPVDDELRAAATGAAARVTRCMDGLRVADALTELFTLFKRCNKYIDETTPWALAKDEAARPRLKEVLYNLVESLAIGASLLAPFLPETAEKILSQLGAAPRPLETLATCGGSPAGGRDRVRRLCKARPAAGEGRRVRGGQALEKALQAHAGRRRRNARRRLRHQAVVPAGGARRQDGRARGQPQAGHALRRREPRHDPLRVRRGRHAPVRPHHAVRDGERAQGALTAPPP